MVYEGGVKVYNADNTAFAFNSPEGVAWLQMYVDMVKAGTVDNTVLTTNDDRVGLNAFSAGAAAFYATGPNLARAVKDTNATLYGNLGMVQAPLGKSNVSGKGLMSISVKKDTKFPNASMALAQFFTNPRSMVEFAKQVAVYPSSAAAYEDPFFSVRAHRGRGQRPSAGRRHRRHLRGHRPHRRQEGRCQRHRPQGRRVGAVQQRPCPAGAGQGRGRRQQAHQVARTRSPRGSHPALARSASGAGQPISRHRSGRPTGPGEA